jgi:hypothetical protein
MVMPVRAKPTSQRLVTTSITGALWRMDLYRNDTHDATCACSIAMLRAVSHKWLRGRVQRIDRSDMGGSRWRFQAKVAVWSVVSGGITAVACFIGFAASSHLSRTEVVGVIALAGVLSALFGGYGVFVALKSDQTLRQVDEKVDGIELAVKNKAVALVAHIFSVCSAQIMQIFTEPHLFDSAVDYTLAQLREAICRCHHWDGNTVRVSLIINASVAQPGDGSLLPEQNVAVRSIPSNSSLQFDFTNEHVREQLAVLMDRKYPFEGGWLWDSLDQSISGRETRPLPPAAQDLCSYIRVGVPGVGVLCVDSSDENSRLMVEDRILALAFADLLAIPAKLRYSQARQLEWDSSLREIEEVT